MFVIIQHGSKQYKVSEGDALRLDYLGAEVEGPIEIERVLFCSGGDVHLIGRPTISGARVIAEPVKTVLGPKLTVTKFKRRKGSRVRKGHREKYTQVRVREIIVPELQ